MLKNNKNSSFEPIYAKNIENIFSMRIAKKKIERYINAFMKQVESAKTIPDLEKVLYDFKYGMVISDLLSSNFDEPSTKPSLKIGTRGDINSFVNNGVTNGIIFQDIENKECYTFKFVSATDKMLEIITSEIGNPLFLYTFRKLDPEISDVYTLVSIDL